MDRSGFSPRLEEDESEPGFTVVSRHVSKVAWYGSGDYDHWTEPDISVSSIWS